MSGVAKAVKSDAFIPGHLSQNFPGRIYRIEEYRVRHVLHRCAVTDGRDIALLAQGKMGPANRARAYALGASLGLDVNALDADGRANDYTPHLIARVSTRASEDAGGGKISSVLASLIAGVNSTANVRTARFPTRSMQVLRYAGYSAGGALVAVGIAKLLQLPIIESAALGAPAGALGAWVSSKVGGGIAREQLVHGASLLVIVDGEPLFAAVRAHKVLREFLGDEGPEYHRSATTVVTTGWLNRNHAECAPLKDEWMQHRRLKPKYKRRDVALQTSSDVYSLLAQLAVL